MSDIPILFKPEMVRPILREIREPGTGKTQTRRILNPQFLPGVNPQFSQLEAHKEADGLWRIYGSEPATELFSVKYAVGDRLWVRESFYLTDNGHNETVVYGADEDEVVDHIGTIAANKHQFNLSDDWAKPHLKLRPSIFLPKIFSRITCLVTDVRVQRLQDISEEDAMVEGGVKSSIRVDGVRDRIPTVMHDGLTHGVSAVDSFRELWTGINGVGSWAENPWIVAVTFKPILKNILEFGETE